MVLLDPLAQLPRFTDFPSLAHRNLLRGWRLRLPGGELVSEAIKKAIPATKILHRDALWDGRAELRKEFENGAPLWFYILREAELEKHKEHKDDDLGGHHLGSVGGLRIVLFS